MLTSKKKKNNGEVFDFPVTSQGLQNVRDVFELKRKLEYLFKRAKQERPSIEVEYVFSFPRFYSYVQGLEYMKLVAHCKYCSHQLVYFKHLSFQAQFKLRKFRSLHVHTQDPEQVRAAYYNICENAPRVYRYEPYYLRILRLKNQKCKNMTPEQYLKTLPIQMKILTKMKLVVERYGITESQFYRIMRQMNSEYQIPLRTLFREFDQQGYSYVYMPKNLIQAQDRQRQDKKYPHFSFKPSNIPDVQQFEPNIDSINFLDQKETLLPNILLIITPQMKRLYRKHGQYVGFDLTFSLIKEKPTHKKQYLVGVFGGTNQSKRIIVYGLVITISQTVQAYKYILTEFIRIMGKAPSAIITDQQQSLYHALKEMQRQKIFQGQHLLDMFHILKKFRKAADGNSFQLYRRLMHVVSREEYRKIFRQLRKQINNDKELAILRVYDMNSQKYCFSQINPEFVGSSISNSINQKFHDILKSNIPYETKYVKAVKVMVGVCFDLNKNKEPDLEMHPDEERLNMPFLKHLRIWYSSRTFKIILREVARSAHYLILTQEEQRKANLTLPAIEQLQSKKQQSSKLLSLNRDHYIIKTKQSHYRVYKKYQKDDTNLMNDKSSKDKGKWYCYCEYEQKTGILCSHLAKVLIHLGEDFVNNLHPRWMVDPSTITNRIMNYKYQAKFLSLRNKHKIRVKGGSRKARGVFDRFNDNSNSFGSQSMTEYDDKSSVSAHSNTRYTQEGEESYYNELDSSPVIQRDQRQFQANEDLENIEEEEEDVFKINEMSQVYLEPSDDDIKDE